MRDSASSECSQIIVYSEEGVSYWEFRLRVCRLGQNLIKRTRPAYVIISIYVLYQVSRFPFSKKILATAEIIYIIYRYIACNIRE